MNDQLQEEFGFYEEKPNHHWHTQIPHCIDDADLEVYEYRVYSHIKRICGEDGKTCFKSLKHLAEHCKMSEKKLRLCLENLCKINIKLGLALLRKKSRKKQDGSKDTSLFVIVNVWHLNGEMYSKKISGAVCGTGGVRYVVPEGPVCGTDKEEPYKNNPCEEIAAGKAAENAEKSSKISPVAAAVKKSSFIVLKNTKGQEISIEESLVYRKLLDAKYETSVIEKAIAKVREYTSPVGDIIKLVETICKRLTEKPRENKISPLIEKNPYEGLKPVSGKQTNLGEYMKMKQKERELLHG